MLQKVIRIFKTSYPRNYILKHAFAGSLIFMLAGVIFVVAYRPLGTHPSLELSYAATMSVYMLASGIISFLLIHLLRLFPYYSLRSEWTFLKEITAVLMILLGQGIAAYSMGFIMEEPSNRLNLSTLLNSIFIAFFIGIIPMGFFTLLNFRHLLYNEITLDYAPVRTQDAGSEKIHIISRLKKEELSFSPEDFIFAEAEGNYVAFHLAVENQSRRELIRNSMNEIEQQLSSVSYIKRVHRAFIINFKKVRTQKGNSLGYRVRLYGSENEIPVSRQNVQAFDKLMDQIR